MNLKQNFKNHLRPLIFHIAGTSIMALCLWVFNFDDDMMFIFMIFWLIYTLPVIYLHIEYYIHNRNEQIEITNSSITVIKKGIKKIYTMNDLSKVILNKSASLDKRGIQFLPLESYYYVRISTKNDENIIITCLLTPKLDEVVKLLKEVPYERIKKLFCSIEPI